MVNKEVNSLMEVYGIEVMKGNGQYGLRDKKRYPTTGCGWVRIIEVYMSFPQGCSFHQREL